MLADIYLSPYFSCTSKIVTVHLFKADTPMILKWQIVYNAAQRYRPDSDGQYLSVHAALVTRKGALSGSILWSKLSISLTNLSSVDSKLAPVCD